mmetsp:Transcript_124714/g.398668  ORF Transcript_124714/g.398668 Transcript_124714/m.398668 type:complete len:126 (-) Transcript_124714:6-383(-)
MRPFVAWGWKVPKELDRFCARSNRVSPPKSMRVLPTAPFLIRFTGTGRAVRHGTTVSVGLFLETPLPFPKARRGLGTRDVPEAGRLTGLLEEPTTQWFPEARLTVNNIALRRDPSIDEAGVARDT